jgi:O-antigen/teichoic acid export membrane protein
MVKQIWQNQFFRNSFISTSGSIAAGAFNYFFHFIISRKLSVGEYGELQTLFAFFAILTVFSTALNYFVIKYVAGFAQDKDKDTTKHFLLWLRGKLNIFILIFLAVAAACTPLLMSYLHFSSPIGLVLVYATIALSLSAAGSTGALNAWQAFFTVNILAIVVVAAKLGAGFVLANWQPIAIVVVASLVISGLINSGLARYFVHRKFGSFPSSSSHAAWIKSHFEKLKVRKAILPIFVFSLMMVLIGNGDILIIKNLTSAEITGYYSVLKILGTIVFTVNMAIIAVLLPHASGLGSKGEPISRKLWASVYGLIGGVSLTATLFYYLAPHFIIGLLFGQKYDIFAGSLWLFGLMVLFLSLLMLEANLAYARHHFKISYVLAAVVIAMTASIYAFHSSINQIVIGLTLLFALGYAAAVIMNLLRRHDYKFEI